MSTQRARKAKPPRAKERPKPRYHHGDLRAALVRASVDLIARDGLESLSLREAAREAGVSSAAPYHHFATKADLLAAIAADGFVALEAAMRDAIAALEDPEAPSPRLQALGRAYVGFARSHPIEFRLMFRGSTSARSPLPKGCDPSASYSLLVDAVERIAKTLPPGTIAPEALVLTAWSLVHGAAELVLEGPIATAEGSIAIADDQVGATVVATLGRLLELAFASDAHRRERRSAT